MAVDIRCGGVGPSNEIIFAVSIVTTKQLPCVDCQPVVHALQTRAVRVLLEHPIQHDTSKQHTRLITRDYHLLVVGVVIIQKPL